MVHVRTFVYMSIMQILSSQDKSTLCNNTWVSIILCSEYRISNIRTDGISSQN